MPVARTYLPLSLDQLESLVQRAEIAGGAIGVAVGPGGGEDAEYAAWRAAADLAAELVAEDEGAASRRVLASADVDIARLEPPAGATPTAVTVSGVVPLRRIVSFHVDEAIGSGVDDLLWFDVTELDEVQRLATGN